MHEAPGSDPRIVEELKILREEVELLKKTGLVLKTSEAKVISLTPADTLFLHVDVDQWRADDIQAVVNHLRNTLKVAAIIIVDRNVDITVGQG